MLIDKTWDLVEIRLAPKKICKKKNLLFLHKTYIEVTHWDYLDYIIIMGTHNASSKEK